MDESAIPSAGQFRAGRALVQISQEDLAVRTGVPRSSIAEFEAGARQPRKETLQRLRRALEDAGVVFIEANGIVGVGTRVPPE